MKKIVLFGFFGILTFAACTKSANTCDTCGNNNNGNNTNSHVNPPAPTYYDSVVKMKKFKVVYWAYDTVAHEFYADFDQADIAAYHYDTTLVEPAYFDLLKGSIVHQLPKMVDGINFYGIFLPGQGFELVAYNDDDTYPGDTREFQWWLTQLFEDNSGYKSNGEQVSMKIPVQRMTNKRIGTPAQRAYARKMSRLAKH